MEPSQLRAPIYGEEISALDAGAREAGTRLRLFRRRFLGRGATWGRVDRVVKREREGGREMVASSSPPLVPLSLLPYSFLFRKSSNRKSIKHLRLLKTGVSQPTGRALNTTRYIIPTIHRIPRVYPR